MTHAPWPLVKLRADYRTFHQLQLSTGDIDPTYPVLDHLATQWGLNREERTRLVFTHVAYYNLGSALSAWNTSEGDFTRMPTNLPTGTERRAHRDQTKLRRHLDHLDTIATTEGGLEPWITRALAPGSPTTSWTQVSNTCLMRVIGNGRWASYKTAEMLNDVAHIPLAAPDMGHAHSTGPRHGLTLLYPALATLEGNTPTTIARLDSVSHTLAASLQTPVEKAETSLCDFHALTRGGYYPGHDIDHMLHQLTRTPSPLTNHALKARAATLPTPYLGELHDWNGVEKNRKIHYARTGHILERP